MDIESILGKKVIDIITDATEVVKVHDSTAKCITDGSLSLTDKPSYTWFESYDNLTVVTDHNSELVICFKDEIPVAIFEVYEPRCVSLNGARGLVIVVGNGNTHEYWFDNGEYNKKVY